MQAKSGSALFRFVLIASAMAAAAGIGWLLAVKPRCSTASWLSAGVAATALYHCGWRAWPAVFVGSLAWHGYRLTVHPHPNFDDQLFYGLFLATVPVLHALCTIAVLGGPSQQGLSHGGFLQRLLFRAAPSGALLSAALGVIGLAVFRSVELDQLAPRFAVRWAGDMLGVALLLPLLVTFFRCKAWREQRAYLLSVGLPIILVLCGSLCGYHIFKDYESEDYEDKFDYQAFQLQQLLRDRLAQDLGLLTDLQQFYRGSKDVSHDEFAAFTDSYLQAHPAVRSLEWAPVVTDDERRAYERGLSRRLGRDLTIRERSGQLELRPAQERGLYAPATFIEPPGASADVFGFDLLSDPHCADVLMAARDTGKPHATKPIQLIRDGGEPVAGTLVVRPIYRNGAQIDTLAQRQAALQGFVIAVFELSRLIEMSWQGWLPYGVQVQVTDGTGGAQAHKIYGHVDQPRSANSFHRYRTLVQIPLAQRMLTLEFVADSAFPGNRNIWTSTVMLLVALLLGALLVALAVARWIERQHIEREQRRLRSARDRVQQELTQLLRSMNEAVFIVDGDGSIVSLNSAASKLLKRKARRLRGQRLKAYLPGYAECQGDCVCPPESVLLAADGSKVPVELSMGAWHGPDSAYSLIFCRDITERKEQAERLEASYEQLQRSNRELEEFAYITSHDLKEPVRGIGLNAQLILETVGEQMTPTTRRRLHRIIDSTKHMAQLVDRVLHCARVSSAQLDLKPTKLKDVVDYAVGSLQHCVEQKEAQLEIRDPLDYVLADSQMLSLVLRNLVSNALKYTDKAEPRLEIGCIDPQEADVPPDVRQQIDAQQSCVVYVRDNGIGIGQEHLQHVFKLFKRLHHDGQYGTGHGAGLTVVKRVVQRHGGAVWVQSELGAGSTFFFTLKRATPVA